MRKRKLRLVLSGVVGALVLASAGSTQTWSVSITRNLFTPDTVNAKVGDVVTWKNNDTVNHAVVSAQAGIAQQTLAPGAAYSFTFTKTGNFQVSDPLAQKKNTRMTVRVQAAALTVALSGPTAAVVYGNQATLRGTVSSLQPNEQVTIFAKPCGATSATKLATVATTTGGVYSALVKPLKNTLYTAQAKTATSPGRTVLAKPRLTLTKPAKGRFVVAVRGAISFSGRAVVLQRWNATLKTWVNVKSTLLVKGPAATAPTIVSKATFRAAVKARTRMRVSISQFQAGSCYRPNVSNVLLA